MDHAFADRRAAGLQLARSLVGVVPAGAGTIVLGLPRGGVPVAFEVAVALSAPLDVVSVRKLGLPGHEELAMGAIATGGVRVLSEAILRKAGVGEREVEEVTRVQRAELVRRERMYRAGRPPPVLAGRTVVLVDDGLATGSTMNAAVEAVARQDADRILVAVPVASPTACSVFQEKTDEVICLQMPARFGAVGVWYDDFAPTSDAEVCALLDTAARRSRVD